MSEAQAGAKRAAALEAAALVQSGMVLGLGTGSTARIVVEEIGRRLAARALRDIVAVPTSVATREQATTVGIPLTTLEQHPALDLTIDGADEVDPRGDMIKGHGGALLWEKIVAAASKRLVIVVDPSKLVERLGTTRALPVEVVPFGWRSHDAAIRALGAVPALRRAGPAGTPVSTDEDHYIIDCTFAGGIAEPGAVHQALKQRPGVVETGLFLGFNPQVIVGQA
jgi:ribose 5-phosphate isomerase A